MNKFKILFNKIFNKDNFKIVDIIQYIIATIIGLIIGIFLIYFNTYSIIKDSIIENNKEIVLDDKSIIDKELDANGKDIIIILDEFNSKHNFHGNDVSSYFKSYFKYYLKKEIDIKIINLSFNKNNDDIEHIDFINYNQNRFKKYEIINKESYQLDKYIKRIRELNPNSKIVLSLSLIQVNMNYKIIELSKKYDYKIVQAYYNPYKYESIYQIPTNIVYFYFYMDYTNTILVSTKETKPLWYIKQISLDDIKHDKELEDNVNWSTSMLTPILGYEYYLNKESNIINSNLLNNK